MRLIKFCLLALCSIFLSACVAGQQRGNNVDGAYVSTTRPNITVAVPQYKLLAFGEGRARLLKGGVLGGLPIRSWYSLYGNNSGQGPLIIVAHGELPARWHWDADMTKPFSINNGLEVFGSYGFQASTSILESDRDPFMAWTNPSAITDNTVPAKKWIVRTFAQRFNFDNSKVILEYREPLPEKIHSLSSLPYGMGDFIAQFEQRARSVFQVSTVTEKNISVQQGYFQNAQWQYMTDNFWGTASIYEVIPEK